MWTLTLDLVLAGDRSVSIPTLSLLLFYFSQDIEGESDDDIPELEEQVGGDDSAEVCLFGL